MPELTAWENFYVIVGSSAGALIGLQFVAVTLITNKPSPRLAEAGKAFSTPTIMHFSAVLFAASIASAPWPKVEGLAVALALIGIAGFLFNLKVIQHLKLQDVYEPVLEDWAFHVALPLASYLVMILSAFGARANLHAALFWLAGSMLALLFAGIHNTWDAVTYHIFTKGRAVDNP